MKFKIEVIEISRSVREVEADNYQELKEKIYENEKYVGSCVEQESIHSTSYEIQDEEGRMYPTVKDTH